VTANNHTPVISNDFTAYTEGELLVNYPTWLSFPDGISPICASGTAIYPPKHTTPSAIAAGVTEGSYPLNQYAKFKIYDTDCGTSVDIPQGVGVGMRGSTVEGGDYHFYHVNIDGAENRLQVSKSSWGNWRNFIIDEAILPQRNQEFWAEVESHGDGTCTISVYGPNDPDLLIKSVTDGTELTGDQMMVLMATRSDEYPVMLEVEFGVLDITENRVIHNVNDNDIIVNNSLVTVNGSGLANVTGAFISYLGNRPYPLTLNFAGDSVVYIEPWDLHDTQLYYTVGDGRNRLTLTHDLHPTNDLFIYYTHNPSADMQFVQLVNSTGPDSELMDKELGALDGDQIVVPRTVGLSSVSLLDNGDAVYDEAVVHGQQHERLFMDKFGSPNYTWYAGTVTVNQVSAAPPVILVAVGIGSRGAVEQVSVTQTHPLDTEDLDSVSAVEQGGILTLGPTATYLTQIINTGIYSAPFEFISHTGVGHYPITPSLTTSGAVQEVAVLHTATLVALDLDANNSKLEDGRVYINFGLHPDDLVGLCTIREQAVVVTHNLQSTAGITQDNWVEEVGIPTILLTTSLEQDNSIEQGAIDQIHSLAGLSLDGIGDIQSGEMTGVVHLVRAADADSVGAVEASAITATHTVSAESLDAVSHIQQSNLRGYADTLIGKSSIEAGAIIQTLSPYRFATGMVIGA
jgi:hypothetical protein